MAMPASSAFLLTALSAAQADPITFPGASWSFKPPEELGLDPMKLATGLAPILEPDSKPVRVFVSRWGIQTWSSGSVDAPGDTWSIGKSFAALVLGRALQQGLILDIDEEVPLSNDPQRAAMALPLSYTPYFDDGEVGGPLRTWRQFLSMTSDFGLANPQPGESCAYNINAVEFYATFLQTHIFNDSSLAGMVTDRLFAAIQAEDGITLPASPPHRQSSGYKGGFQASARDIARLGVLLLANGTWGTEKLISASFAVEASQPQVPASTRVSQDKNTPGTTDSLLWNQAPLSESLPYNVSGHDRMGGDLGYGFSLFIMEQPGAFHMSGKYGNYVIVDRSTGLVIAVTQPSRPSIEPKAAEYLNAVRRALIKPVGWSSPSSTMV